MSNYLPLLIVGAILGVTSLIFLTVYLWDLRRKEEDTAERQMPDRVIIRRLLHYARPYRGKFLLVAIVMLLSIAYNVLSPLLVGQIQKLIREELPLSALYAKVAVYAGILLVSLICTYLQAMLLQQIGQKILSAIREDVFEKITSLSHAQLNKIPVGKLVTRVSNDPNAINYLFTNILVTLAKNILVIFGVLGAMLLLNYALTLMVLCFVPALVLFTLVFRRFSRKAHRKVTDATTDINTFLSEDLSGMKITQSFCQEDRKMAEFIQRSRSLQKAKQSRMLVFSIFRPMVYMLFICSQLFLFYLGARGHLDGWALLGQTIGSDVVVAFYMYISKFFEPIQQLAEQFDMLQRSFASAEKIFTILDMEPEVVDGPDAIDLPTLRGHIRFQNVWFAYEPDQWVLKDVSFTVEPGQTVAFVGATGSGKTTILSLLCRNYDIQRGQILIDGIDIRKIRLSCLRRHFGQMLQDVFLFSGTIESNITLGGDFPREEIDRCCRYVNADRFISKLEKGLQEQVLERGGNFSAGQRQLLSFARTILHKPSVMILDEATANIDTETEQLIQNSLEKMKEVGTMLVVAHRLSTIQHADNIILLSHGRILEQGTHAQLLSQRGRYHKLYTLQFNKEKLSGK